MDELSFVWLEITGKCQLECAHCYADSGPQGTHGAMLPEDWTAVIDESVDLGTRMIQFIGGEPTLHPALPELVDHALGRGLEVEVFSNLVHVPEPLWEVFSQPKVRLATSYYADEADHHESITRRRGSYTRTKTNIVEALRRSIPLRVGLIDLVDGQHVDRARAELAALGVTEFGVDRLRQVGRGVREQQTGVSQLCGHCARGKVAIATNGDVWPCVFSRWIPVGNVRQQALAEIVTGRAMNDAAQQIAVGMKNKLGCDPLCCPSTMCDPQCSPSCSPSCRPANNCRPSGNCAPRY
jgi:MoaA/NifB/PqqE/SkfB family radical SAM enzyme